MNARLTLQARGGSRGGNPGKQGDDKATEMSPSSPNASGTRHLSQSQSTLRAHSCLVCPCSLARCGAPRGTQQPATGPDAPSVRPGAAGLSARGTRRARNRPRAGRKAGFPGGPRNAPPRGPVPTFPSKREP